MNDGHGLNDVSNVNGVRGVNDVRGVRGGSDVNDGCGASGASVYAVLPPDIRFVRLIVHRSPQLACHPVCLLQPFDTACIRDLYIYYS